MSKDDRITKIFRDGIKQGMYIHAWMKDGVSYIGQHRPDGTGAYELKEEQRKVDEGKFDNILTYPKDSYDPILNPHA